MSSPQRWALVLAVVAMAWPIGWEQGDRVGPNKSKPGEVTATTQRPGDPKAGYHALLNQPMASCGVPYSAYRSGSDNPDPALRIPGRIGRNAELPYMATAFTSPSGVELVTSNCLVCHAATINGEIIIGLGNEFLDFTGDPIVASESLKAYVKGGAEVAEWRKWADRVAALAPYMRMDTIGVNPANNLALALMAHRDPETLAWSDEPLMEPPPERPLPVSVPPWWTLGKKHALYYNGQGRGDHARFTMLASMACTDSVEEAAAMDAWFPDARAYIASLGPPAYPYTVDRGLVQEGRDLFEDNCASCHGTYGDGGRYPNRVVALEKIGTDPALAEAAYNDADRFSSWFDHSFYGEMSRVVPALGYIALPLDGVWATAPYLHNGSIPTIAALLKSRTRPTYWRFAREEPDFDEQALGWSYTEVPYGKEGAMSWNERNRIYDTTLNGYSNQGHNYGDGLSESERMALIEYLKTI